jgi:hypothetical protein
MAPNEDCACGGSGRHSDEVDYLRKRAYRADELEDTSIDHWADATDRVRIEGCRARLLVEPDVMIRRRIVWQWIKMGDIDLLQFKPLIPLLLGKS